MVEPSLKCELAPERARPVTEEMDGGVRSIVMVEPSAVVDKAMSLFDPSLAEKTSADPSLDVLSTVKVRV
jgi:hypothetical protein